MAEPDHAGRRRFLGCAASALMLATIPGAWPRAKAAPAREFKPARLTWPEGQPLRAADLVIGKNYVFDYPFQATPCFLLNLAGTRLHREQLTTAEGRAYTWNGGCGPKHAIVAFSAICPHRLTYPHHKASFISYRHESATFEGRDDARHTRDHVIHCCSEGSVFDVTRGGAVIGGPAPEPIAAIALEHDPETDTLTATAVHGAAQFDRFFEEFGFQLQLQNGTTELRQEAADSVIVQPLAEYSNQVRTCRPDGGSDLL